MVCTLYAVSYTHLDVYKRQVPYSVEVRTSSGYNDFTTSSETGSALGHFDFVLLKLRHMALLRESDDRKRKNKYYEFIEGKMKRPLNSFMLYRSTMMKGVAILKICSIVTSLCKTVQKELPALDEKTVLDKILAVVNKRQHFNTSVPISTSEYQIISKIIDNQLYQFDVKKSKLVPVDPKFSNHTLLAQIITLMWNTESTDCKNRFVTFSQVEKEHHHLVYPKYKYCPVKKAQLEKLETGTSRDIKCSDSIDEISVREQN